MAVVIPKITIGKQNDDMLNKESLLFARISGMMKPIMEYFKKDVVINFMHGEEMNNPQTPNTIVVNLWSANKGSTIDFPMNDKAFGYTFCPDAVFKQNDDTVGFGDEIPLIQYVPTVNKIDFLYDVCEFKSEEEMLLMKKLLLELLYKIAGSKEEFEKVSKEFADHIQTLKREALLNSILEQEKSKNQSRKQRIESNTAKAEQIGREVRMLLLAIETDKALVEAGGSAIEMVKGKIAKEFEIIQANSKVVALDIHENGHLNIFTKILYANVMCPDKKIRRYLIGRFRIMVNIANGSVKFYNLDKENTRNGMWSKNDMAPHVSGKTASGCLGSAATLIADTVDQYQWGALADILINYLESVNIDDSAGSHFYKWQEVDKDDKPIVDKDRYIPSYGARNKLLHAVMDGNNWNADAQLVDVVMPEEETLETAYDAEEDGDGDE